MMNLYQMNGKYRADEDRIIFRMKTRNGAVLLFSLTRRFVRLLWPVLADLLKTEYAHREPGRKHLTDAMVDFEGKKNLAQADFRTPFETEGANFPLGEKPVLLTRIVVKKNSDGTPMLCMLPPHGRGIELPSNPRFIHSLRKLICDLAAKARWDLDLEDTAVSVPERPASAILH